MRLPLLLTLSALALPLAAQSTGTSPCPDCATWNAPQRPFRIFGNTYFVGTHGLSAILIVSRRGHVLIDGGLPESAPQIAQHIRDLGFRVEDIKVILNSHVHFDHAGGIAALQRLSGAEVAASPATAATLRSGKPQRSEPQFGSLPAIPRVAHVRILKDRQVVRVETIAVTAIFTPGHSPGGTSWQWSACERETCATFVYADSQTPIAADDFFYTKSTTYPQALEDFARGQAALDSLPCSILLTPHPDASSLWQRLAKREAGDVNALVDPNACRTFAANARATLAKRIARERR